jgi:hypothetical protein
LASETPEPTLSEEQGASLLDRTRDLIDALADDESLDGSVRDEILEHLLAVQDALSRVSVAGTRDVKRAADGLMGVLIRTFGA